MQEEHRKKWGYEVFHGLSEARVKEFFKFHNENPEIYQLFKQFAKEMRDTGRSKYSSKAIMERIRWHYDIRARGREEFKINNNYTAMYPRIMIVDDNSWLGFFNLRKLTTVPTQPTETEAPAPAVYQPPLELPEEAL